MNNSKFIIALLKCPGIGPSKALQYIISNNLSLEKCITNIDKIVSKTDFDIYVKEASEEIELNKNKNISIITIFDNSFPSKLYTISDPILYLYYSGNISLLNELSVAIIGTRHPSDESVNNTKILSKDISNKYVIVGGLALGIDTIGHKTSIECGGKTIAVLPSPIDDIQPRSNRNLAKEIINNNGLLVSEYSTGVPLSNFNYAKRDRIQAALADIIIVPEAKEDSGTMIAVKKAIKEKKKVYQLSGNNNKIIEDTISLVDDYMINIDKAILNNQIIEKEKYMKLTNQNNTEQISLF
jgi:DNA processing protein